MGATLSDGLHTPPLPVVHAVVGYRWSYNESATAPCGRQLDNDRQSFRSCLLRKSRAKTVMTVGRLVVTSCNENEQEVTPAGIYTPAWVKSKRLSKTGSTGSSVVLPRAERPWGLPSAAAVSP